MRKTDILDAMEIGKIVTSNDILDNLGIEFNIENRKQLSNRLKALEKQGVVKREKDRRYLDFQWVSAWVRLE